jgi:UDP-2,3-diacylglucosamine pyrophosphatase LpxH
MSEGCLRFKTIFLSDIHLGTRDCKAQEVTSFLRRSRCEKLVLNGDIIDGWALRRGGNWSDAHTGFVRLVLEKMERENMQVVYLRGNHDDILERFLPLRISALQVETEHIHASPHGRYLVVHGDGFDRVTTNCRWLAVLGSVGYSLLLRLNRSYNRYRNWRGLDYYSLSRSIKARVKSAVSFVSRYEEHLRVLAKQRGCSGIICGHIHSPCDLRLDGIHYLNSGDWVESLTAVVERLDRSFEVLHYREFLARLTPSLNPQAH